MHKWDLKHFGIIRRQRQACDVCSVYGRNTYLEIYLVAKEKENKYSHDIEVSKDGASLAFLIRVFHKCFHRESPVTCSHPSSFLGWRVTQQVLCWWSQIQGKLMLKDAALQISGPQGIWGIVVKIGTVNRFWGQTESQMAAEDHFS